MKIWEIDWTADRTHKCLRDENIYTVSPFGEELISESGLDISDMFCTKVLIDLEFEEVVDWSKVEIDTKVLIYNKGMGKKQRAYFAGLIGVNKPFPAVFKGGCNRFTAEQEYGVECWFWPNDIELYKIKSLSF